MRLQTIEEVGVIHVHTCGRCEKYLGGTAAEILFNK